MAAANLGCPLVVKELMQVWLTNVGIDMRLEPSENHGNFWMSPVSTPSHSIKKIRGSQKLVSI